VSSDAIVIDPGQSANVPFSIVVPKDAESGGHFGGIFFSSVPVKPGVTGSDVSYELGTAINIMIAGNIVEVTPDPFSPTIPLDFASLYANLKPAKQDCLRQGFGDRLQAMLGAHTALSALSAADNQIIGGCFLSGYLPPNPTSSISPSTPMINNAVLDSQRIKDLQQVQVALESYFAKYQTYPGCPFLQPGNVVTEAQANTCYINLSKLLVPTFLGSIPSDPWNVVPYLYEYVPGDNSAPARNCSSAPCLHYILGVSLVDPTNVALLNDDNDSGTGGFAANNGFSCADPIYCLTK
jgi:hypothetical protein